MVTYIYFVKCPNCEDEHFDFFDDAKGFAMGCLSKKPIITQTEVCRNDFGECTDSSDLGTVWSWEDEMKDTETEEPGTNIFSKGDFGEYNSDNDPEFADEDDDFRLVNGLEEAVTAGVSFKNSEDFAEFKKLCDEIGIITMGDVKNFMRETGANDANILDKLRAYRDELGADFKIKESVEDSNLKTWNCWYDNRVIGTVEACDEDEAAEKMMSEYPEYVYDSWDHDFSVEEVIEESLKEGWNADVAEADQLLAEIIAKSGNDSYDDGDGYWSSETEWCNRYMYYANSVNDVKQVEELCAKYSTPNCEFYVFEDDAEEDPVSEIGYTLSKTVKESRKPVPEGMTIEQLVEEMEENEDEVECTWCNDLFHKDQCRKEVNLGWLCSRCADGIMSRGETLTFKENNYWDFLDEKFDIDFEDEAASDMLDAASDAEPDDAFNLDYPEID